MSAATSSSEARLERTPTQPDARDRAAVLNQSAFVREVLRRSPNLEAARQGWRAALAQYPQKATLDDPMLEYSFAPLSIASNDVSFGQVIAVSQRFPWPGKLALEGEVALAEAEAAQQDFESARRSLAVMATTLFHDYYAVVRSLETNHSHQVLVEDIKKAAEAQYAAGRGSQQEALQAEVELANVAYDRVMLEARRSIIVAQMNGLLRRPPERSLPEPPELAEPPLTAVAASEVLRAEALQGRPELRAVQARIRGRQSAIDLADRRSYPDLGVMAAYNSMWRMPEHQWMLGFSVNIPIQTGERQGAADQAEAERAQAEARLLDERDAIGVEVERARQGVIESQRVVQLYRQRLLPAARAQIDAARIGYATGQTGFQALVDAERSVRTIELRQHEALAALGRAWAQLERSVGRLAGISAIGEAR